MGECDSFFLLQTCREVVKEIKLYSHFTKKSLLQYPLDHDVGTFFTFTNLTKVRELNSYRFLTFLFNNLIKNTFFEKFTGLRYPSTKMSDKRKRGNSTLMSFIRSSTSLVEHEFLFYNDIQTLLFDSYPLFNESCNKRVFKVQRIRT